MMIAQSTECRVGIKDLAVPELGEKGAHAKIVLCGRKTRRNEEGGRMKH
jgi:hypothetical protein